MLTDLLEQDHRQQIWSGPAAGRHMERRGGLADALAVAAGELLPHVLDDLPLAGHDLKGLGRILAELGQAGAAAAGTGSRTRNNEALARQMVRERAPGGTRAGEACDSGGLGCGDLGGQFVLCGRGLQLLQLQFHLVQQTGGALGARAETVAVELLDLQLEVCDQGQIAGLLCPGGGDIGACGQKRRLERIDIIRQGRKLHVHARIES